MEFDAPFGEAPPPRQASPRANAQPKSVSSGALALLTPSGTGSTTLVFARTGSGLPDTLTMFGSEVRRLRVSTGSGEDAEDGGRLGCGRGDSVPAGAPIPVASESIDQLFLESGLRTVESWSKGISGNGPGFLAECRRVLRPGGTIVLVERNLSLPRLPGRNASLGAPAAEWRSAPGPPRSPTGSSARVGPGPTAVRRLLEGNGFGSVQLHIPWPEHAELVALVCGASVNRNARFEPRGNGRVQRAAGACYRLLQRVGLHLRFVPEIYVIGRKAVEPDRALGEPAVPALARVLALEAPGASIDDIVMDFRGTTNTMTFRAGARFFKVPLTPDGKARLALEQRALRRLAGHPLAPHVLGSTRFASASGVPYSSAPFVDHAASAGSSLSTLRRGLRLMSEGERQELAVSGTATWKRVACAPASSSWSRIGAGGSLPAILEGMADRRIPVGVSHGDFHEENLLEEAGRVVIIDWDRLEEPAPLFLDPLSALCHRTLRRGRWSSDWRSAYLAAIDRLMNPDASEILTRPVRGLLGELTWREAVALYVVSYAHRWAESAFAGGSADEVMVQSVCRDRFARCAIWLREESREGRRSRRAMRSTGSLATSSGSPPDAVRLPDPGP